MKTSGHKEPFIRQAVEKGIKAFREKIERSQLEADHPGFQPLYQKAGWKRNEKSKEKALKKSNWFRGDLKEGWKSRTKTVKKRAFQRDRKVKGKNTTVVFVPSTKGGLLVRNLKEEEDRMGDKLVSGSSSSI